MIVLEFKVNGKQQQYAAIEEAIRAGQFVRNKCLRFWIDNRGVGKADLNKLCAKLAKEFGFVSVLNSQARQASAERAWSAIARFFDSCKAKKPGKKGYPKFKKHSRSVEYKTSGWKLDESRRWITFTDGKEIGKLKLIGTRDRTRAVAFRDLNFYQIDQIKRVRLVKRADGYYAQFCVAIDVFETVEPTQVAVGLDVGLNFFYTDSTGDQEENPRFYRKSEQRLKKLQRRVSKKFKKPKKQGDRQSNNYKRARKQLALQHLKVSRQRQEHAKRLARSVCKSNDFVAYEDLQVRNLVKNHNLAKSINDVGWYQFRIWVERFGKKFGKATVAVPPQYTSQECSSCGILVKKSLSTRTHVCQCGCVLDRDENAAINILKRGLSTVGHTGTLATPLATTGGTPATQWLLDVRNAWGDEASTVVGENLLQQVLSTNQESPGF